VPNSGTWSRLLADRLTGAVIDSVEVSDDGLVKVTFRHRGTDDDSGHMVVGANSISFYDEEVDV
jgi:hypothetical protein